MVTIIEFCHILELIIFCSIIVAGLSTLLKTCFGQGHIFGGWLPFVANKIIHKSPNFLLNYQNITDSDAKRQYLLDYAYDNEPIYKPLGGCLPCMNVWIASFCSTGLGIALWSSAGFYVLGIELGIIFVSNFFIMALQTRN